MSSHGQSLLISLVMFSMGFYLLFGRKMAAVPLLIGAVVFFLSTVLPKGK